MRMRATTIDWATKTSVSELVLEAAKLQLPENNSKATGGKTVLLTGAAGFLGRAILKQLVADEGVAQIHYVSVRPNADGSQRKLAVEFDKVVIYSGDMTSPLLGLTGEEFPSLAATALL
jgi:hybrid polyketide synthase/nonribosomal peptide synthetase ACE1